jgi:aryl-alcohol dehydrogenase-like predicted oxidoreductase
LIQTLEKMAVEYGATPGQIALNWLINYHPDTVVAIPGASNPEQARQNAGAMGFCLSDRDMVYLDEITRRFL